MPEPIDRQRELADQYAAALFELASQAGTVAEVRAELEELVKLEQVEPDFRAFMTSRALDDDHRAAGLEKMFRGRLSDLVLDTLQVMNAHGRSGLLDALCERFIARQEEAAGQVRARAASAVPLSDELRNRVAETVARLSGRSPVMQFEVDPGLLGGIRIQIGDVRYDNTIRRHLELVRRRLEERAQRGLAAGSPAQRG